MRNERIRIVIADDEQNICEMLKRLIRFDDLGLELIGMVSNGEDLRNVIVKEKPDIVITAYPYAGHGWSGGYSMV